MTSSRLPALLLLAVALACGTRPTQPDDEGSGGASSGGASTGGTSSGGGGTGGDEATGGSAGSGSAAAINPETGLPQKWEIVLTYEEGDGVELLDDGGLVIHRTIPLGEFTTDEDYELHYVAPGETTPTLLIRSPDSMGVLAQDEAFLYLMYAAPDSDRFVWTGRIGKPGAPVGLGGETGAPTGLQHLIEHEGYDPTVDYFGQNETHIFFTYTGDWDEGQLRSVDKATGTDLFVDGIESLYTGRTGLVMGNQFYLATGLAIFSGTTTPGEKAASGTIPDLCAELTRNATGDGWWALCEADMVTSLVEIDLSGGVTKLLEGVSWLWIEESYPGEPYVLGNVTANDEPLSLYDVEAGELRSFGLDGLGAFDLIGVFDGYVYVHNESHNQVVRAELAW